MDTKGYVLIAQEFRATKIWPNKQLKLEGTIDLEAEYKASLAGKVVPVMDISTNGDAYLVIGNSSLVGHFLWQIEAKDVVKFLPIIVRNGRIMPAGLSPIEEFEWIVANQL